MSHDWYEWNWLTWSMMVLTSSSTADLATRSEWADRIPLIRAYARPRKTLRREARSCTALGSPRDRERRRDLDREAEGDRSCFGCECDS
jgi:hypothetical protein